MQRETDGNSPVNVPQGPEGLGWPVPLKHAGVQGWAKVEEDWEMCFLRPQTAEIHVPVFAVTPPTVRPSPIAESEMGLTGSLPLSEPHTQQKSRDTDPMPRVKLCPRVPLKRKVL